MSLCDKLQSRRSSLAAALKPQESRNLGSPRAAYGSRAVAKPLLAEVSMLELTLIPQGTSYQLNKTGAQG